MAFDARIIVINKPMDQLQNIATVTLAATNMVLNQFKIHVIGIIEKQEYENCTSSKEINKYIRVRKADLIQQKKDAEEQFELLKVGTGKYSMERFASAKVAFVSISAMGNKTVIWFSFHSRLMQVLPGFTAFWSGVAEQLSYLYACEAMVLHATSMSRHDDFFSFFVKGKVKNKLSGKAALTDVKSTYGVDINMCMNNIDENLAIVYAPADYAEVKHQMAVQKQRFEEMMHFYEKEDLSQADPGKDPAEIDQLKEAMKHENDVLAASLQEQYALVKRALQSDPIGGILYFRMDDGVNMENPVPSNEREFGRDVSQIPVR